MKPLIAYYSRTGRNETIAQTLGERLGADLDEIVDHKKRTGLLGWLRAGRDAGAHRLTTITVKRNPADYDVVLLGGPIWNGNLTPALRTYLTNHKLTGKRVAFFFVSRGNKTEKAATEMQELANGAVLLGTLGLTSKEVASQQYDTQLRAFVELVSRPNRLS
jgi:flavodoxin